MSAFIAAAFEDRVELLTDGASVTNDGTLAAIGEKVWRSESVPLAFTGRGNTAVCEVIGTLLVALSAHCGSFDETVEQFGQALSADIPKLRDLHMDGVICGMSETAGAVIAYFTTSDTVEGYAPFLLHDVRPFFGQGSEPPEDVLAEYGLPERAQTATTLAEIGADAFEAMRREPMNHFNAGGHKVYGIGGHVDLTVINANGARTERLREWPEDVIGRKIEPDFAVAA